VNNHLKYGSSELAFDPGAAAGRLLFLEPGRCRPDSSEEELIRAALAQPIGSRPLTELVRSGQRVAIITSDITRPCPSPRLLPAVLAELSRAGIRDEDVTVIFGLGSHRAHTPQERVQLAGDAICRRVRCIDSDPNDVAVIGHTSRGTPVAIFRPVLAADVRVCLGAIEYHYFAGYSGGYKAIIPGVAGLETIQHNHCMMTQRGAAAGNLMGNPVRADIEEAGVMVGVHFILNVTLDEAHQIVSAVAGHPQLAHREGCARLDAFGRATVPRPADVVVVSAGGLPRDINLYQAQKALENARYVVRPGGVIVLVAECREGMGHRVFAEWMRDPGGPDAILDRICREFVLGGHKAAAVAMALKQAAIYLVSRLPADDARAMGFRPFTDLNEAFRAALAAAGPNATVAVLPDGGAVLPSIHKRIR
jgi:nickel-dependent lactate racemase